jgi:abequosyltransferase
LAHTIKGDVMMANVKNDLLSICIPTYNHAEPLRKSLEVMIPQALHYNIPIYISDNASTDNTAEIVESFRKTYPYLYFRSNKENLGVDQNMGNAARMASSKYVWVIGARRIVLPGMLDKIYGILIENELDLLVLNDLNSTFSVPESQRYTSARRIFLELHRNLTGLGFQILPAEAWKSDSVLQKHAGTEWTIVGLTLEYIANKPTLNAFFLSEACATSSGPSHWRPKYFQIWANWKKTIRSLPATYSDEDKEFVIRNSVRFLFVSSFILFELRAERIYNSEVYKVYGEDIIRYGKVSPTVAYLVSKVPVGPLNLYFMIYAFLRRTARKFMHQKTPLNPTRKTAIPYL